MAGDLQTPYTDPAMSPPDPSGSSVNARGGDPNVDLGGNSGLQPLWNDMPVSNPQGRETANSVSGMPLHADRWEPSGTPPQPPSLEDRSPGTIDER